MGFLTFGAPWLLLALALLPTLWWLLRLTPPRPKEEVFPPLKILAKITNFEDTPQKSPWWLALLRFLMAGLVILALAQPALRPKSINLTDSVPLVLIMDNSFNTESKWQDHIKVAKALIEQAGDKKIYVVATADPENQNIAPLSPQEALKKLATLDVKPLPARRQIIFSKLADLLNRGQNSADIAYLTDGLAQPDDQEAFKSLNRIKTSHIFWYQGDIQNLSAITSISNNQKTLDVELIRAPQPQSLSVTLIANDAKNRVIAQSVATFKANSSTVQANFDLPVEMRNDISFIKIQNQNNAGAIYLTDSSVKRRKVAILTVSSSEMTQPLLTPMYYVTKALTQSSDVILSKNGQLKDNIDDLLNQNPSALIIGDLANIAPDIQERLNKFVLDGGTIIRFAGPRLANEQSHDNLLPVKLREGERGFGGIMSWTSPQKLGAFPKNSLFADLTPPQDIIVNREILAEPDSDLFNKTWINLADNTPLVTAQKRGKGELIFIHTSADLQWSNLALSGFFVEMLKRMVDNSQFTTNNAERAFSQTPLAPWRLITHDGNLSSLTGNAQPIILAKDQITQPSLAHPAGLYGKEDHYFALNLLNKTSKFAPLSADGIKNVTMHSYSTQPFVELTGLLLTIVLILFALDCLIVLKPKDFWHSRRTIALLIVGAAVIFGCNLISSDFTFAVELKNNADTNLEQKMINAAGSTHLAYVKTGNKDFDDSSKLGLEALGEFIEARSTVELGDVVAIDLDHDELAFYPLIYWPIDPGQPEPSAKAIANINTFMQHGGTVLFDTKDQLSSNLNLAADASPATERLRDILKDMDIPTLEPVSKDNVLSRSFFIMPDFPGRYRGSSLWAEAMDKNEKANAPIHGADGVSPILITANDLSGAWATDGKGGWKFPLVPDDNSQRTWAFRGGMNIVMYVLTGNYKADQIHASALLKRFGKENKN